MKKRRLLETTEKELAEIQCDIVFSGKNSPTNLIKHLCELQDEEMINKIWIAYLYFSNCDEPIIAKLSSFMVEYVRGLCNPIYHLRNMNVPYNVKQVLAKIMGVSSFDKLADISVMVIEMKLKEIQIN